MDVDVDKATPDEPRELVRQLLKRVQLLEARFEELDADNERLRQENQRLGGEEGKKTPSSVKLNRPKKEREERKEGEKGYGRRRD